MAWSSVSEKGWEKLSEATNNLEDGGGVGADAWCEVRMARVLECDIRLQESAKKSSEGRPIHHLP